MLFVCTDVMRVGGEEGIRTLEGVLSPYSLSRGVLSTAQPPLQRNTYRMPYKKDVVHRGKKGGIGDLCMNGAECDTSNVY